MGKRSAKRRNEELVNYKRCRRQDSGGKEQEEGEKNWKLGPEWVVISKGL
jgi:hypothetical protein